VIKPPNQPQVESAETRLVEELKPFLDEQSKDDVFSGSVLVVKDGQPILEFSSGIANQERKIPNQMETKFNLGSANKMFTGVAIAQLVEKGLLNFEDVVGEHLQGYPNSTVKEQVTIHHLLTHTSGLGSFIDTKFRKEFLETRPNLKTIQAIVDLFKNRPLPYPIGEFHYSSDGYELLGAIIEAVSGQTYYEYVKEHIFDVAGMSNTGSPEIDPENPPDDIAIGYTNRDSYDRIIEGDRFNNLGLNLLKGTAGGAGYSTCEDLLKFSQALLGNKLLSSEMTKVVLKPRVKEGSREGQTKYSGYGFQIFDTNGFLRVGHPGRFAGVNTRVDMYPQKGLVVIALANYDPPSALKVGEKAEEIITPK